MVLVWDCTERQLCGRLRSSAPGGPHPPATEERRSPQDVSIIASQCVKAAYLQLGRTWSPLWPVAARNDFLCAASRRPMERVEACAIVRVGN